MNLKVRIDETCEQCDEEKAQVIVLEYCDGENTLCAQCLENYLEGKIKFL